jgi:hypothetical protein
MRQPCHSWIVAAVLAGTGLVLLSCVPDGPSGSPAEAQNDDPGTPVPPAWPLHTGGVGPSYFAYPSGTVVVL